MGCFYGPLRPCAGPVRIKPYGCSPFVYSVLNRLKMEIKVGCIVTLNDGEGETWCLPNRVFIPGPQFGQLYVVEVVEVLTPDFTAIQLAEFCEQYPIYGRLVIPKFPADKFTVVQDATTLGELFPGLFEKLR